MKIKKGALLGKFKKGTLLDDNAANAIVTDSIELLRRAGYGDDSIAQFTDNAVSVLNDYAELVGVGTRVEYYIAKKLGRIELKMSIPGAQYDPLKNGKGAKKRRLASVMRMNLNTETARVCYNYAFGSNIISVSIPLAQRRKSIIKDPVVIAVILGAVLGFLCQYLPIAAKGFVIDDLASPLMSIILDVISGIMGPVIFISMTTSIIALDSINDLTNLGFKRAPRCCCSATASPSSGRCSPRSTSGS